MTVVETLVLLTFAGLAAGFLLLRCTGAWPWQERLAAFLVSPLLVLCITETFVKLSFAKCSLWDEIRLARTFGLYAGIPFYPGKDATGPILGTLHTPLSHILYWPATLAPNAVAAVRAGVLLSVVFVLAATLCAHLAAGGSNYHSQDSFTLRRTVLVAFAVELCWLGMMGRPVKESVFLIHADPLALACATFAGCLLAKPSLSWRRMLLSATFAILAVWSKQTFITLPFALCGFLWFADGWRTLRRYIACLALAAAVVSSAFLALFSPIRNLFFNIVTLASHRPPVGATHAVQTLFDAADRSSEMKSLVLFILILLVWLLLQYREGRKSAPNTNVRLFAHRQRSQVFFWIALGLFPLLLKARHTVGGDRNHLAVAEFFILLGLTASSLDYSRDPRRIQRLRPTQALIFVLVFLFLVRSIAEITHPREQKTPFVAEAAAFALAHPGVAYFADDPLASLYAEHRFHTIDHAIFDRELAGFPVTPAQFASGTPKDEKLVVVETVQAEVSQALTDYLASGWAVEHNPELPDFTVYRRLSGHP